MNFNITIRIPAFLGHIYLWFLLTYKGLRYGCKFRYIPLNKGFFVIVDQADYEKLVQYNWSVKISPAYAVRIENRKTIYMHNQIMQPQPGFIIDHKDHEGLNNTRTNLRLATKSQNCCNQKKKEGCSSKYKGVYFNKALGKWGAAIKFRREKIFLGYFDNEIEAAKAYDEAARALHKEFAVLNFP